MNRLAGKRTATVLSGGHMESHTPHLSVSPRSSLPNVQSSTPQIMPVNHSSRHFIPAEGKERMHSFVAKKLASVFRGSESSRPALQAPPRTAQRVVALQKVPDRPPTEGGEGMIKSAPRPTVHIIDDDAHAPHALSCLLRSYGYSVQSYANATQFLRQNLGSEPACLVLDLKVPECNGLKLQEILSRG